MSAKQNLSENDLLVITFRTFKEKWCKGE